MSVRKLYPFVSGPIVLAGATALTATMADIGDEIDARNCNKLTLLVTLVAGTSTDPEIQLLGLSEFEGSDEYTESKPSIDWGEPATGLVLMDGQSYQFEDNAGKFYVTFDIPVGMWWQVQKCDAAAGSGTIAIKYIKSYE